jgi:hypothetical protein
LRRMVPDKSALRYSQPIFRACNDVYQVLLRKQRTPLFLGTGPRRPGRRPDSSDKSKDNQRALVEWNSAADEYSRYYLTLFRPNCIEDNNANYNWDALNEWIESIRADRSIMSKFRLIVMHQHMRGMKTKFLCKKWLETIEREVGKYGVVGSSFNTRKG